MVEKRLPHTVPHYQIKDSGHWIHADQQEAFCRTLVQILLSINNSV
jgi:pimeloyl-ACP methyl ester carboxylesterase